MRYVPAPPLQRTAVSGRIAFSFDDGNSSDMVAAAILERYGGRGMFAPYTNGIGSAGRITAAQLQYLAARGHEIASHTMSHTNLTTLTNDQVDAELRGSKQALQALGIIPWGIVYPQGAGGDNVHRIASRYYRYVRLSGADQIISGNCFLAGAYRAFGSSDYASDVAKLKQLMSYLRQSGQSAIVILHGLDTAGEPTSAMFADAVRYAYNIGLPMVTVRELVTPYNEIADPWWECPLRTSTIVTGFGWTIAGDWTTIPTIQTGAGPWGDNALTLVGDSAKLGSVQYLWRIRNYGSPYLLRVPYKIVGRTTGSFQVGVWYYNSSMVKFGVEYDQYLTASADTDWTIGQMNLTLPTNATYARISLYANKTDATIYVGRCVVAPAWAGDYAVNP